MDNVKIGYDDNLGLPNNFSGTIGCDIVAYHDVGKMVAALEDGSLLGIFTPAGTLPYVKNYEVLAQALLGPKNQNTMQTNFVSAKNISIADLSKFSIGRVNQYCTTSFWAPLIYLMQSLPQGTSLTFKDTDGFQDMLRKTAEQEVDCSMVWSVILQKYPQDASKVHELFHKSDLPTPVIISTSGRGSIIKEKLNKFISQDKNFFFNGFQAPDMNLINKFILDMKNASQYFQIKS